MSGFEVGLLMFGGALVLVALRMNVAGAMLMAGGFGYVAIIGWDPLINTLKTLAFSKFSNYSLSILPFFLLMGEFATRGGMNVRLYAAARAWFGHWRGGLAIATIGGCASFGAVSGSSFATAATMSKVALPEMKRANYSGALSTATVAAGGTLGILIPPSIILVIYAIYAEISIGALFVAALIPGLFAVVQYMIVVNLYARIVPDAAPRTPRASWSERLEKTKQVWPLVLIFTLVIVGIYRGWFSPTAGGAIGAFLTLVLAVAMGGMRWKGFVESVLSAGTISAMMYLIMLAAELFSAGLALTQLPNQLASIVAASELSPYTIMLLIMLAYLVLGCFMESLAMVLLTLPVFIPMVLSLDFGLSDQAVLVWFGILVLMSVEVGMITPPFGLNLFMINSLAGKVPITDTYRGVIGFCGMDILRILLILFVPMIALWLPGLD